MNESEKESSKLADFLWSNMPGMDALLIITQNGDVLEYRILPDYEKMYDIDWFKTFAKMISIRFPSGEFHNQLGGLHMTVNIFREKTIMVSPLKNEQIAIMMTSRTTSFDRINIILSKYYS